MLVGLALVRLGSPLLCHIDHELHIAPQVDLSLQSLVCHCNRAHLYLVQAFWSQLVIFA